MSKTKALKRPARSQVKRPAAAKTAKSAAKKVGAGKSASGKSAPKKAKAVATRRTAGKKVATKKVAAKAPSKKESVAATTSKPSKKTAVKPAAKRTGKAATKSAVSKTRPSKTAAGKGTAKAKAKSKAVIKSTSRKPASVKKAASKSMVTTKSRGKSRALKADVKLPEGYRPSAKEPFMSDQHQVYFRNKLVAWKEDIIRQTRETLLGLTAASEQHADVADRATSETDRALELRARDRQRKLVSKINSALARIEEGSYGYCEETGEPIGLRRLEARPIATLSLEAQERHERRERVFRED